MVVVPDTFAAFNVARPMTDVIIRNSCIQFSKTRLAWAGFPSLTCKTMVSHWRVFVKYRQFPKDLTIDVGCDTMDLEWR